MRFMILAAVVVGFSVVYAGKVHKDVDGKKAVAAFNMMNEANLGASYEERVKPMDMKFGFNASLYFDIGNGTGVVFRGTTEDIVSAVDWSDETVIYLVVNISPPGAGVYLSSCNGSAINLMPSTMYHEIRLSEKSLNYFDCFDLHLIRTEGSVDGMVTVVVKPKGWYHIQIIIGVFVGIIVFLVLLRQCANYILGIVYSYAMMEELHAAEPEYY